MATLTRIFRTLRGMSDASVDAALAASLPTADAQAARLIALLILERKNQKSLSALVTYFHILPTDVQSAVIRHAEDFYRPLREAATRHGSQGPVNALAIIRDSASARLAYLVAELIRNGGERIRPAAADCLLEMTRSAASGDGSGNAVAVQDLIDAVEDTIVNYRSHQLSITLQGFAMLLPRSMPKALAALEDPRHPAIEPMRAMLRDADGPAVQQSLFTLLAVPSLADSAAAGIRHCLRVGRFTGVMRQWPLILAGDVSHAIGQFDDMDPREWRSARDASFPEVPRGLAEWTMHVPLAIEDRVATLEALADHQDQITRLSALRRLIAMARGQCGTLAKGQCQPGPLPPAKLDFVQSAIASFCVDQQIAIARIAVRHLVATKWKKLSATLMKMVNTDRPDLRTLASEYLAPIGFKRFWDNYPKLTVEQRLAAGRALIKIDPCFHQHLAEHLEGQDDTACLRAVGIIQDLNQANFFEAELLTLCDHRQTMVAASAVKALGAVPSDAALHAVEAALEHRDDRIRANAVEALHAMRVVRHVDRLASMSVSEESRARANAIGHLLDLSNGQAMTALRMMLDDERQNHRASALWLVETAGLIEVARHVAEMSISDPDSDIRRRAVHVVDQLIKVMDDEAKARDAQDGQRESLDVHQENSAA